MNQESHAELDQRLTFNGNVLDVHKNVRCKNHALIRGTPYINLPKKRFSNTFFFSYNNLEIVLSYGYGIVEGNNSEKFNRLNECSFQESYYVKQSSFDKQLEKDQSFSLHNRNLHQLATFI